jgi:hypothetical protein
MKTPGFAVIAICCWLPLHSLAQEPDRLRAYAQPTVPEGWTETPFVETAATPELSESERRRGYLLFHRPITEPVHPNSHPLPYERLESLVAFATPGEFEPVTLSLYPIRELKNLSVRCSDLTSGSDRIEASEIDVRLLTYWNIGYPRYASRETWRRLPELLERVTAHSSPKQECQRWWLTIHVPDNAKAGLYRGTVTLKDDGFGQPVRIPLTLRVLGFQLRRDPRKHLSAYYYPRNRTMFEGRDDAFVDQATANEYQSMVDHGLDMLPTMYLQLDRETESLVIQESGEIDRMLAAGLQGPLPVLGGNAIERIYIDATPGGKRESHWQITRSPPPEFYKRVTRLFRRLKQECAGRGWPELICCPLDEVAASSNEFGSKVYQAVKAAGVRTYATKSPNAPDAVVYQPFVDVWCSQPYARPYDKVIADKQHRYWSYPNHNAGERKNRRVMCKGGRMTYGFGFWRSGYTTLIPWHWAWTMRPDPMDYLRTRQSGCGQRIDQSGEVIPSVYWECFREGHDDARYLYTLQQAAWERAGSSVPECRRLVGYAQGKLQQIWDAIDVQERYLDDHLWPSSEFNARRWQMALLTQRLLQYPAVQQGLAPSVYVQRTAPREVANRSIIQQAEVDGKLESLDLGDGFSQWKAETPESSIRVVAGSDNEANSQTQQSATLRWNVDVDHDSGGTSDGKYNVGWPRVRRVFAKDVVDMTAYDFLEILVRVDSNRDEVQDDVTMLGVSFSTHDLPRLFELQRDLGDRQRETIRLQFSISEIIRTCNKGSAPWKSLAYLQLFVAESNYADGTSMQFDFQRVRLLRFQEPMISRLDVPGVMMLPRQSLPIPFQLMGTRSIGKNSHRLTATLINAAGQRVTKNTVNVAHDRLIVLDTSSLSAGSYRLETAIVTDDGRQAGPTFTVDAVAGPARQ